MNPKNQNNIIPDIYSTFLAWLRMRKQYISLRGCAEQAGLLQLELVELLLTVHLDDERHDEDQERGSSYPRRLSGAPQELLGDEAGVGGRLLALV